MGKIFGTILGSGLGTRLRALTDPKVNPRALPKFMMPVANLHAGIFSVEALKKLGLSKIYVATPPHSSLSKPMEHHLKDKNIFEVDIEVIPDPEGELLDTAGTLRNMLRRYANDMSPDDTIVVLPNDTPHNIDLNPVLQAHLQNKASATIVSLPIDWTSNEWEERTFGMVQASDMPKVEAYLDRKEFEDSLNKYVHNLQNNSARVTGYITGHPEMQHRKNSPASNLINTGIYFFRANLLLDVFGNLTPMNANPGFSDFGLHIFPLLAGRFQEFEWININFKNKIKSGHYPFYTYILPAETYWQDVGTPLALLRANMDVIEGKVDTRLAETRFWHWPKEGWGWKGNFGTSINPKALITGPEMAIIKAIVGSHVVIDSGRKTEQTKIERSVILDHNTIQKGAIIINSVCFPNTARNAGLIGTGITLINSIFIGGMLQQGIVPSTIVDSIVYENIYGGISIDPLVPNK